jgi:hypothetical protein
MPYTRINLSKTNYDKRKLKLDARTLTDISKTQCMELEKIYDSYVKYKKFDSVMPLFFEEYRMLQSDVHGYYDNNVLVAFSLMFRYNSNPKLSIGTKSLKWECAHYKELGFDYIYLGDADGYKQTMQGFEVLGPRH